MEANWVDLASAAGSVASAVAAFLAWRVAVKTVEQGRDMRMAAEEDRLRMARERVALAASALESEGNTAAALIHEVLNRASVWFQVRNSYGGSRHRLVMDECSSTRSTLDIVVAPASEYALLDRNDRLLLKAEQLDDIRVRIESMRTQVRVVMESMKRRYEEFNVQLSEVRAAESQVDRV
ncbi:MAG: hypothetical protein KJ999_21105 [Gammaproteobacteria bacterium]|nr:hypothetical protein [Gammaproteobacteria bacterium]